MEIISYASIFVFTLTMILGIVVLAHDPKNKINITFALLALTFAIWVFANLMVDLSTTNNELLWWLRLTALGTIFIPILFFEFFTSFPKANEKLKKLERVMSYPLILFSILAFFAIPTDYDVKNVKINYPFQEFTPGSLYSILFLFAILSIIFSVFMVIKKLSLLDKQAKNQLLLILIGISITVVAGIGGGILLLYNIYSPASITPLFSIFFTAFTAYAIMRYFSFNIRIVTTELFIIIILSLLSFLGIVTEQNILKTIIIQIVFISVVSISYFLIRSIILEDKRKKQIQELVDKLKMTNEELKKLGQLKDDFLHLAVHEINTPMTSILGYLSMILDERIVKIDKKAENYLQKVYTSSKRLANVVANFLDIVKIEGGKLKLELTKVRIEELFQEMIIEYEEKIKAKNNQIKIQNFSLDENIEIEADKDKMKEAFINLIDNAIKFTNNGLIEVFINTDKEGCKICIKDNGIGISSEKLEQIFDKFYQATTCSSQQYCYAGTGLGLYITKSIIEMHSGTIKVESILGKGTKFIVSLPIKNN